jgi:hypothetical protein
MNLARVSIPALVSAFLIVSPGAFSQVTVLQEYASACYLAIGDPKEGKVDGLPFNPFTSNATGTGLNCKTGTEINIGGTAAGQTYTTMVDAQGRCLSPSWAPTHEKVVPPGIVDYQCFPDSWVKVFNYTNPDNSTVTGALLCKNENPANRGMAGKGFFDYASMILYNNKNGKSCWFSAPKADTGSVGTPKDRTDVRDPIDPIENGADAFWEDPRKVATVAQCWRCHDNGVWMYCQLFLVNFCTAVFNFFVF